MGAAHPRWLVAWRHAFDFHLAQAFYHPGGIRKHGPDLCGLGFGNPPG